MEQSGVSTIATSNIGNKPNVKSKNFSIAMRSNGIANANGKLKSSWFKNLVKEEASISDIIVIALAEIIGTAMLMCLGCSGCLGSFAPLAAMQAPLSFGLAVMTAIQSTGHISGGHINPSMTLASMIMGYTSLPMASAYIVAQFIGAIFGFGLIKVITPEEYVHSGVPEDSAKFCANVVHDSVNIGQALGVEVVSTGILAFFACSIWDPRNKHNSDSVPLRFGLCVTLLATVFGHYTGCGLNPARSLAPAIWNGYWDNHWIFWLGPFTGAIIGSVLYKCIFQPKLSDSPADRVSGI